MAITNLKTKQKTHEGLVISLHTTSFDCGYDTIYCAVVWDWKTLTPTTISYHSTLASEECTATVDAAPEVVEAYEIYKHNKEYEHAILDLQYDTQSVNKYFTVIVSRGRLVKKGTVGIVYSIWDTQYGTKVRIEDAEGNNYITYAKNVDTIAVPLNIKPDIKLKNYPKGMRVLYGK